MSKFKFVLIIFALFVLNASVYAADSTPKSFWELSLFDKIWTVTAVVTRNDSYMPAVSVGLGKPSVPEKSPVSVPVGIAPASKDKSKQISGFGKILLKKTSREEREIADMQRLICNYRRQRAAYASRFSK